MKSKIAAITILILTTSFTLVDHSLPLYSASDYIIIENFDQYGAYPFPTWKTKKEHDEEKRIYSILEEDGRKFLRGTNLLENTSIQIVKLLKQDINKMESESSWNIVSYPYLSWDWRINVLPENGNESDPEKNDSAAGIYVFFQTKVIPFMGWRYQPMNWIKYVWSTTLPVGTVISRRDSVSGMAVYDGRYIVVASGSNNKWKWVRFKRNVLEDYEKLFGEKPRFNPAMIGILTDANSTESNAEADYDNIRAYTH